MSTTEETRQVQIRNYLEQAQMATEAGDHEQAAQMLTRARTSAASDAKLLAEYHAIVQNINAVRAQQAEELAGQVEKLLEQPGRVDETQVATLLARLDWLDSERAATLKGRVAELSRVRRGRQQYLEAKARCETLWSQVDAQVAADTPYSIILTQTYEQAVHVAEQACASASDVPELKGLLRKAQYELDKARKRFEILSTAAETGEYQKMLRILDQEQDESKQVQLSGPSGEFLGTMTVRQAQAEVLKMAAEFAYRKAMGYLQAAQVHVENHTPGAAKTVLDRRKQLFALDDEAKGQLEHYLNNTVLPELEKFEQARDLLAQAENAIDPVKGWDLTEQTFAAYQWMPGLDEVRASLLPRLQEHVELLVKRIEAQLEPQPVEAETGAAKARLEISTGEILKQTEEADRLAELMVGYVEQTTRAVNRTRRQAREARYMSERTQAEIGTTGTTDVQAPEKHALAEARAQSAQEYAEIAQQAADRVSRLADLREPLATLHQRTQQLLPRAQARKKLEDDLTQATEELRTLLKTNPAAAGIQWEALTAQYDKHIVESFKPLQRLGRDLDARLNVRGLIARLEQDFASNDPTQLAQAIKDCTQAAEREENADFATELSELRGRLESRLAYLVGLAHMRAGEANEALKQFQKVSSGPEVPDAKERVTEIEEQLKKDQEVEKALKKARTLLPTKPRQAYEGLTEYKDTLSRHHDDVVGLLADARAAWEKRVREALERGLEELLDGSKVANLRRLENELRVDLGVPSEDMLSKRVLARCFAHEAGQEEKIGEWKAAIQLWDQAIARHRIADYVLKRREAQKRQAEQFMTDDSGAAEAVIQELQKELPGDPELQYWAANLHVKQARQRDTSAVNAEALYHQAVEEIAAGLEKLQVQSGVEAAALRGNLETLQKEIQIGLKVEQAKQTIERQLSVGRTVKEFYVARNEAEALLDKYLNYPNPIAPTLPRWWRGLKRRTVHQLEQKVSEITADRTWEHFEPLSKILALDEGHAQAVDMLGELNGLVGELQTDVNTLVNNRDGLGFSGLDQDALDKQIERAWALQRRGNAVYATLIRFSGRIKPQGQGEVLLNNIGSVLQQLQETLTALNNFNHLKSQAEGALTLARSTNDWNNFDRLLEEIAALGFGAHRTTADLRKRRNEDRKKRQELLKWAEELEKAAQDGNFVQALRLAKQFHEPQTGDKDDVFGVQRAIRYQDPTNGQTISGLRNLEPKLQEKAKQLEEIGCWLLESGLKDVAKKYDVVSDHTQLARSPDVVDWKTIQAQVIALKERGNFSRAAALCRRTRGDDLNQTEQIQEGAVLLLTGAIKRLSGPPISLLQANSPLARDLLEEADRWRAQFEQEQEEIATSLVWLKHHADEWEDRWAELTRTLKRLRETRTSLWLVRREERIQAAQTAFNQAVTSCREICPHHPDLDGIDSIGVGE